jgi:hypothetical protein
MSDRPQGGGNDLAQTVEQLQARVGELEKQVKDARYILYKLLYEMGGKEIMERGGREEA